MLIVETKEQLKRAKESNVSEFKVVGELADKLYKAQKISNLSKKAVLVLAGAVGVGAAASPFTAGTSLGVSALATTAAASTVGTGAIIAAVSAGGILLVYAFFKDYSIKFKMGPGGMEVYCVSKKHKFSVDERNK